MKSFIFIFLFLCQIFESYSREPLLTDIVDKDINITASFDGAKIIIYGTIDSKLYKDTILIINVLGPTSQLKIRKKEKYFGVWLAGNKEKEFFNAPGYYAISSNIEDLSNINANIFKEFQIGWENLQMGTNFSSNINTRDNYKDLLKIFYKNRGLFQIGNSIDTIGDTLFRAEFILPAITPTGMYSIRSFLFSSNGKLISTWNNSVKVSKEGLAEDLYDYSIEHPFLYGLLAALGAIIAGYIASEIFRRI